MNLMYGGEHDLGKMRFLTRVWKWERVMHNQVYCPSTKTSHQPKYLHAIVGFEARSRRIASLLKQEIITLVAAKRLYILGLHGAM